MASADVRDELNCSVCLNIYTDPVMLSCGHNFCRACIGDVLDSQDQAGVYTCPECRAEFQERPVVYRNRTLNNIAQRLSSTQPMKEDTGIYCTYCDLAVSAVRTCLHCEASLCNKHVDKHSRSVEHVLIEPTQSLENRKCSVHKEVLKYYCKQDETCICASCWIAGAHGGHEVEMINEAAEKVKKKLRTEFEQLKLEKEELQKKATCLHVHRDEVQKHASGGEQKVNLLFSDIGRQMEIIKKQALSNIKSLKKEDSINASKNMQTIKQKTDILSARMGQIEKLCNMTDPIPVIEGLKPKDVGYLDTRDRHTQYDLDDILNLVIVHVQCLDLVGGVTDLRLKHGLHLNEATDILLDVNTASNKVSLSKNLKTASDSKTLSKRPNRRERFHIEQVLGTKAFSSGQHYWEVETSTSPHWIVGLAYASINRTDIGIDGESTIGHNNKSWGFNYIDGYYNATPFKNQYGSHGGYSEIKKLGIYLDYEAGRLSFYKLGDPVRHLATFTATFTEPLYPAFFVHDEGWIRICS
ncbi:E3 ubiquitin/ISG15 ligase TRIM25-like [Pelobates fuscus]|uniref:E3 ubiquitin/ISG15 ligase TRIM25-like n=1 Tax=Pelobates fuscus TaxID=191477 RepID=UPI002FE4B5C4